jgi:3-oxoacyl-[acyl-carrier protein] reductase
VKFQDKVVLVTGSSRGIGSVIATEFAKEGAYVILCSKSEVGLLESVQRDIRSVGGDASVSLIDVTDPESIDKVIDRFANIDILVNNAGNFVNSVVKKMDKKDWADVIDVNLTGVFNCTRSVLRKTNVNRIINITSVQAQTGVIGASNYAAAKAGVIGFTKSVAQEVARKNITVNAIALGFVNTGMLIRLPEKLQQRILDQIPMGRFGYPKEVAYLVMFLASNESAYITGQTINMNGGYYMGG